MFDATGMVNIVYHYVSLYPCTLLCFVPFAGSVKAPLRKIAFIAALATLPFALGIEILAGFGISNTAFLFSLVYMAIGFFCLRRFADAAAPKRLFVFFMVAHVAVMGSEMDQAFATLAGVPILAVQRTRPLLLALLIVLRLLLYAAAGLFIARVLTPCLLELEAASVKGLWTLPLFFAALSIYRTATYSGTRAIDTLFPLVFLLLAVTAFAVYALILRMLDATAKNARVETQARLKQQELAMEIAALERMNQLKNDFMATVSHEARTPLAVLASYAGLVSMELRQKGVEAQTAADLDRIVAEAKRVANLIDSMKQLAVNAAQPAGRVLFNLDEMIRQTTELYRPILERAGVGLEVHIAGELPVYGRPEELTQVLFNLLQNAKEHTENGSVFVAAQEENGGITVTVADTGAGVPPQLLAKVLERGVSGKERGTGLGLAICKEILDACGGSLRLENREPCGLLVTITLPKREAAGSLGAG